MAYPVVSAPYGLKPMNEIGGLPYAGSTRMVPIPSGFSSSIGNGDIVYIANGVLTNGTVLNTDSASAVAGTIGIFIGAEFTNPNSPLLGKMRQNFWPANTVTNDAVAYVVDDPNVVFKAVVLAYQANGTSTADTTLQFVSQAYVGTNLAPVSSAVNLPLISNGQIGVSTVGLVA